MPGGPARPGLTTDARPWPFTRVLTHGCAPDIALALELNDGATDWPIPVHVIDIGTLDIFRDEAIDFAARLIMRHRRTLA